MNPVRRIESLKRRYLAVRPWTRHSLVLLVGGIIYIFVGLSKIINGIPDERESVLVFATDILSIESWGRVFVILGFFAILTCRWPSFTTAWGYSALTGFSAAWAAFHIEGILFLKNPSGALSSALLWAFVAFMWWAISGLQDPDPRPKKPPPLEVRHGAS